MYIMHEGNKTVSAVLLAFLFVGSSIEVEKGARYHHTMTA